jgi:hypothetical protein
MWRNDIEDEVTGLNWLAILSLAGSTVCSMAIWVGLIQIVKSIVR